MNQDEIAENLANACEIEHRAQSELKKRQMAKAKDRLEALDRMIARLYEDLLAEKINESVFDSMMAKTVKEQETLNVQIEEIESNLADKEKCTGDAKKWLDLIREYSDIKELDAEMLNRLIKQIVVHEDIDPDGTRNISLEIHYNFKPVDDSQQYNLSKYTGEDSTSLVI